MGKKESRSAGRNVGATERRRPKKAVSHRIASVEADGRRKRLHVTWADGTWTEHDFRRRIAKLKVFAPLADAALFERVRVIWNGVGLEWTDEIDFAADALWYEAYPEDNPFPNLLMTAEEFRGWMAENGFTLEDAAEALGLSRRQIAYYASSEKKISKTVWLACGAISQARYMAKKRRAA